MHAGLSTRTVPRDVASFAVDDRCGASADTVAVAIERILERQQRLVADGFDEASAEQRDRHPPREDIRFPRQLRLTAVRPRREHMDERVTGVV